ncbi:MAG TPA: hypothetical protein VGX75_00540 [bacterium]|nr:hypothetical protein [bacterium]
MKRIPGGVDAVRLYLQKRIDRSSARIAAARKKAVAKPRRGTRRRSRPAAGAELAARRAYRDALRALSAIRSEDGGASALRLAAEEVERVKSALARIYEVTQHANHDIASAGDWAIVEGEAQAALNTVREAERNR